MSKIELILLISACLVPFVAFIFIMPKLKKKNKDKKSVVKEEKPEEKQPEIKKEQPTLNQKVENKVVYNSDDFKGYLQHKEETTTKPKRKKVEDLEDFTFPYEPFDFNERPKEKPKNDFAHLSPEIKALMIAGILDPKF